jgi:hypothetical protein
MIVRELVAKFGIDFDDKGAKRASSVMDGLKGAAVKLVTAISAGAIAKGLYDMVEMAAQAEDTLSLLKATFGASADAVTSWANANADALGRSEFKLREYAAAMGVVAKGLTGSEKEAATIGTTFAKLAVDMKSFFPGKTDLDALHALRSALTGETEPMKQFGVVMDEAGLAAFALRQGNQRLWKDMSAAEKTMVRFNFIMASTMATDVWGTATKEADNFSNRVERLKNKAGDLATKLGMELLPYAQKFLDFLEDAAPYAKKAADAMKELAEHTGAFATVAGIAGVVAIPSLIAGLVNLYRTVKTRVLLAFVGMFMNLSILTGWLGAATTATWSFIVAWGPVAAIAGLVALVGVALYALWQQFTTGENFIANFLEKWLGVETWLVASIGTVHEWFKRTWTDISDFVTSTLEKIRAKIASVLPEGVLSMLAKVGVDLQGAGAAAHARTGAGAVATPGSTVASRSVNVTNGAVNVTIQGNATPGVAEQVGKEVRKALDSNNRNLAQTAPT